MYVFVKRNKLKILFFILLSITIILSSILMFENYKYDKINNLNLNTDNRREHVNKNALPLIENNNKYIELQTKNWIKQRKNRQPCYGLLEKDKIIMTKWMKLFDIKGPKIHYFNYHNEIGRAHV